MSGIAGIVNFEGEPVRRPSVQPMVDALLVRGSDRQGVWGDGNVCLVHTASPATDGPREQQPYTLDGEVWIVADARVDGREALARELSARTGQRLDEATDVELILRSYMAWGSGCADRLLGDFAFAVWDGRSRRLFCARDHFGVKPFYYARSQGALIFSNTLRCVLAHPAVTDALHDVGIADFLLFGYNKDEEATAFADVKRLAAGSSLAAGDGRVERRSYWHLPVEEPLRYRRGEAYVEHFRELFDRAVSDRLRASPAGVLMSGGLDSTSIAATAHAVLSRRGGPFDLHAFTTGYQGSIPDTERRYGALLAEQLGMSHHFIPADGYTLYEGWERGARLPPQPTDHSLPAVFGAVFAAVARHAPVVLTGMGGDPALFPSQRFPLALIPRGHLLSSLAQVARFAAARKQLPPLYLRTTLRRRLGQYPAARTYPPWVAGAFARRLELRARWEAMEKAARATEHPWRPEAYRLLQRGFWQHLFENHFDAAATGQPVEVGHPYFDVRLLTFLLRVPPLPWFIRKEIVRQATRDRLPEAIRLRPKTTLAANPLWSLLEEKGRGWVERAVRAPSVQGYVDAGKYLDAYDARRDLATFQSPLLTRPLSLAIWLRQATAIPQR